MLGPSIPNFVYLHHCQVERDRDGGGLVKEKTSVKAQMGNLHIHMYGHNLC